MVVERAEGYPIGFVQATEVNIEAGWCMVTAQMEPEFRGSGHHVEAYALLVDLIFRSLGLRKIYVELPEFAADELRPLLGGAFVQEGCFAQHVWFDGRFWDVLRYAVFQDAWAERRDRVTLLLDVGEQAGSLLDEDQNADDDA